MRSFKAAAMIGIVAMAVGTGFCGSRATMAETPSQSSLYVSNVLVGPPYGDMATGEARQQWLGRDASHVIKTLGEPSQVYRMKDTGGDMLVYVRPNQKHYVFEVSPGRITPISSADSAR